MFLYLLVILAITCGIVAITTFFLYAKARMEENEQKEKMFLNFHYASLFILFLVGLVYIFYMIESET